MGIVELPPVSIEGHTASGQGDERHPMRIATRRAAGLADQGWTDELRGEVRELFDSLAGEWHTRGSPERAAVVADALDRGQVSGAVAVEVGSGIGLYSAMLAERFRTVVAVEISAEMLARAAAGPAHRVLADASVLPMPDGSAEAVVLINAFLFPAEVARVLAPRGAVVWVNSSGEATPIHLTADEVAHALPGDWDGVASRAGLGTWCVLRRAQLGPVPI